MIDAKEMKRLMDCFIRSGAFINHNLEFIAHRQANEFFRLEDCETVFDVQCKVLEWLSRAAYKTEPWRTKRKNDEFHREMQQGINAYLGTEFTTQDFDLIYSRLGNRVNHALTVRFVESGYDLRLLEVEQDGH